MSATGQAVDGSLPDAPPSKIRVRAYAGLARAGSYAVALHDSWLVERSWEPR